MNVQEQHRGPERYVGLPATVTIAGGFGEVFDSGYPELFGWLAARGVDPAGAPFVRYLVIDMDADIEMELGVPVVGEIDGDDRVRVDELPGGAWLVLVHEGSYDGILGANAMLQEWADVHGVAFDAWETERGTAWRGRVERFLTNPAEEQDVSRWQTEIAYLRQS
jgi:effector-binding domain-containing protein